jgi:fructose-specific phosphotransferase system IIC component
MLDQIATVLGVKKAGLIAGFIGALISLRFIAEATTWPSRIFMALAGTMAAAYLTPGIAEYLGAGERVESALAFCLGLFGMTASGAIMHSLRELKIAEAVATWFKKPGA